MLRKRTSLVLLVVIVVTLLLGSIVYAGTDANPGDIVINEIMQNPSAVGDSDGEWFEIKNVTGSNIDINGWTIKDDDSDSHVISNGGPLIVPAGGYLVLCRNSDSGANGGVTCDYQYSGFTLANGADEVVLVDDGATPEEIDRVDYDGGGSSGDFPDPNGASMAYGGPPDATTDPSIDNNDGTRWGTSTSTYGDGDAGTPGTKNDDVLGPNAVTLSTLSASGFNPTMLALSLVAILALGAGAFVLRRRAVL
ncbi:MAG TPA: lamin tail domain-containing protein [Caldilineae bacterium]|nr:lamin tail domain-containing protein [Caldilineae bacterium]